jgi:hypothetical protein
MFLLGVLSSGDEPPDMEPGFYEVRILGEGINDSEDPLMGNFLGRLSQVATNWSFTRSAQSLILGAWRSHFMGLGRHWTVRHVDHTQAGSHPSCGI